MNEDEIKEWLLGYAWLGTLEERAREVDCIMAQEDWKYLDARTEHLAGQASGEEPHDVMLDEAAMVALSSLYECHDGPHLPTCPRST